MRNPFSKNGTQCNLSRRKKDRTDCGISDETDELCHPRPGGWCHFFLLFFCVVEICLINLFCVVWSTHQYVFESIFFFSQEMENISYVSHKEQHILSNLQKCSISFIRISHIPVKKGNPWQLLCVTSCAVATSRKWDWTAANLVGLEQGVYD